jgi:hypothetical protein
VADVVMNVSPLGSMAARGVKQGAMAAGRAGEQLAERVVPQVMERGGLGAQLMGDLALGSRSQVIKPKGGNWLAGSVERSIGDLKQANVPQYEMWGEGATGVSDQAKAEASSLNRWLDQKLSKYIRNEMGTPEDPLLALAERGVIHEEQSPLSTYNLDDLEKFRERVGYPAEGIAKTRAGREWEAATDYAILPEEARNFTRPPFDKTDPWLFKVPPETPVYAVERRSANNMFGHLVDELRNAVDPSSGLPENLRWKYQDLDKVTVPQAVQRVSDINAWRAAQKAEADMARAMNPATQVVKEYPEQGFKWVELRQPKELPEGWVEKNGAYYDPKGERHVHPGTESLADALKYEGETMGHCVGGYCPDVVEGRSRIYSLRDKKGQPHVTIEVAPREFSDIFNSLPESDRAEVFKNAPKWANDAQLLETLQNLYPEKVGPLEEIVQIKGKGNKAPNAEYLPAVQDFVRSGNWSNVGDLKNTGLVEVGRSGIPWPKGITSEQIDSLVGGMEGGTKTPRFTSSHELARKAQDELGSKYITEKEYSDWIQNQLGTDLTPGSRGEGFAQGGLVSGANFHTGDFDPARIDTIVGELHALNQA